jgi:hypothetical protein
MSMMSSNPSPISSTPVAKGHIREQFLGDGQKDTFDLHKVPSSVHAITARVSGPLHLKSIPLIIGNLQLETFAAGYDALVDRLGRRICLEHALPQGELLLVEYPVDDPSQSPAMPAALNSQVEPLNIPGWEFWDYQNWRDFVAAMCEDRPIEYAMCVWLMQQESTDLAFQDGEWSEWYHYARRHCPRFDQEQPRRR